jgi:alpha-glucosidase
VLARRAAGQPLRLTGLPPGTRAENLYGGAESLYTGTEGAIVLEGDGPAFQVWALQWLKGPQWSHDSRPYSAFSCRS